MGAYLDKQKVAKGRIFEKLFNLIKHLTAALIILSALFGIVYCCYILICCAGFFNVTSIEVVGDLSHLTNSDVVKLSGVEQNQNMFLIDVDEVSNRLKLNPWVDEVAVRRKLPGSIWIYIIEHIPEAILALDNLYYVDVEGSVFKKIEAMDEKNFPIITGVQILVVGSGEKQSDELRKILEFKKEYEKTETAKLYGLSEVNFDEQRGYALYTVQGSVRIDVGTGNFEKKFKKLDDVLAAIQRQKGKVRKIDLNYDKKVIVKYS